MDINKLIKRAKEATKNSYSPYSSFKVGAALLCNDGKIFCGCNIENASFSPTVCAERVAFFNAISNGYKKSDFRAIAIVCEKKGDLNSYASPCGVCRQVMLEFCDFNTFEVILAKENEHKIFKLGELIPHAFSSANLD